MDKLSNWYDLLFKAPLKTKKSKSILKCKTESLQGTATILKYW